MDIGKLRRRYVGQVAAVTLVVAILLAVTGTGAGVAFAATAGGPGGELAAGGMGLRWDICIGAAVSIGAACLAAGYAIGKVGAAALGAASEKPELLTRSLVFVALGEGLVVFGFLIALLMVLKL